MDTLHGRLGEMDECNVNSFSIDSNCFYFDKAPFSLCVCYSGSTIVRARMGIMEVARDGSEVPLNVERPSMMMMMMMMIFIDFRPGILWFMHSKK